MRCDQRLGSFLGACMFALACVPPLHAAQPRQSTVPPAPVGRGDPQFQTVLTGPVSFAMTYEDSDRPQPKKGVQLVIQGKRHGTSGFAQEIRVSSPGGSNTLMMSSSATVQVVAKQVTCGQGGAAVPVKLDYSVDSGQSWIPMFSGQTVSVGNSEVLSITNQMQTLRFRARTQGTCGGLVAESIDPNKGMILQSGQNWACMETQKGVQGGFDGQPNLSALLAPYVDSQSGNVTVNANQVLVPFEFFPSGQYADFQDLVLLVTTSNPVTEGETVEFDWIGNTSTSTTDMGAVDSASGIAGDFGTPGTVVFVDGCESRRLKEIRGVYVGAPTGPQPPPIQSWGYRLLIWNSVSSYLSNGANPSSATFIYDIGLPTNDDPYVGAPCNGQLEYLCPWGDSWFPNEGVLIPTFEFKWNLLERLTQPIVLGQGQWVLSVVSVGNEGTGSHLMMSGTNMLGGPTGLYGSDNTPAMWNWEHGIFPNWPTQVTTLRAP